MVVEDLNSLAPQDPESAGIILPGRQRQFGQREDYRVCHRLNLSGTPLLADLPEEIRQAFPKPAVNREAVQRLSEVEKDCILAVSALDNGNQTRTTQQLGIGAVTLYRTPQEIRFQCTEPEWAQGGALEPAGRWFDSEDERHARDQRN